MPTNLNSEKYERYIRALFVGPTGRGKTIAAASWPGKTLIIDIDNRHAPIIDWYPERVAAGDFSVESISAHNFWTVFQPIVNRLAKGELSYDNVILDGITSLSNVTIVMQMITKGAWGDWKGKAPIEIQKDDRKGSKITAGGVMVPGWDEFNGEAMLISTLLETLKSLKCNLFITAHPVKRTMITGTKAEKYTSITTFGPKVESIIPTYFDEVWFFDYKVEVDNNGTTYIRRLMYSAPSDEYLEAKTSIKKLPAKVDYTDKNLYDVIKEYI